MMILTGIFLFALGTKFVSTTPIQTEVKYEGPNQITIKEDTGNERIFLPGAMPPYGPNFIHQGSNFFFNPQLAFPSAVMPSVVETVLPTKKDCETVNIINKPEIDVIVEEKPAVEIAPVIEMDPIEIVKLPEEPIIIPEIISEVVVEPLPERVEVEINSLPAVIPAAPELPPLVIPELPLPIFTQVSIPVLPEIPIPQAPIIIEEPVKISGGMIVSEIPSPPKLPPLVVAEIPKPVLVEDKKVILIPSPPELPAFVPSQVVFAEKPLLPTACVQNIVLERVLPHIMYENTQRIELISFPATRSVPIRSPLSFFK